MSGISNDPEFITAANEDRANRVERHSPEESAYHSAQWPDEAKTKRLENAPEIKTGHRIEGVFNYDRAGADQRNEVYEQLSKSLTLNERDAGTLEEMGIDKETAIENGYRSVPTPAEASGVMERLKDMDLRGVPGFYKDEGGKWKLNFGEWKDEHGETYSAHQGMMVPVRDIEGRIEGFQIDRAEANPGEPKQIWFSSIGKEDGASIHAPDDFAEHGLSRQAPTHYRNIEETGRTGVILITEGALKADAASQLLDGKGAVGVADLRNIPEDFGTSLKEQIPEAGFAVIVVDSDFRNSPEGKQALKELSASLSAAGLESRALVWDERHGNSLEEYLSESKENREMVGDLLKGAEKSMSHSHAETRTQEFGMHL